MGFCIHSSGGIFVTVLVSVFEILGKLGKNLGLSGDVLAGVVGDNWDIRRLAGAELIDRHNGCLGETIGIFASEVFCDCLH